MIRVCYRHPGTTSGDSSDRWLTRVPRIAIVAAIFATVVLLNVSANAQSGLRQSLERLDTDEDGKVSPEEITPLARPYLERITKARRMRLDRPNDIDKLQEAARIYYALQNGVSGEDVEPNLDGHVASLMPDDDDKLIPAFGLREVKYPYTQSDLDEAARTLRRYDRNRDGYIDRREADRARWTHRDPFNADMDKDNRLSKIELSQRYARRRMIADESDELVQRAKRVGNGIESSDPEREERRNPNEWWQRGGKSTWLTATLMGRFDRNRNGRLESNETIAMGLPISQMDLDRNGELSREELHAHVSTMQDELGDESKGLPSWFFERDLNGDGQVSMTEFTEEWSDEIMAQFLSWDTNEDGLLTETEMIASKAIVGGTYSNRTAEALPPGRTIISEIEVAEDFPIGDLNLQLSLSHSNVSHLDAYLTGPDGERIELFTEVGGGDDNFQDTVFDDQAERPIEKGKPPFEGSYRPEGASRGQAGLSAFTGKSIKGVWQLVIRGTRNERFGMLHHWSLLVRPQELTDNGDALSTGNAAMGTVFASEANEMANFNRFQRDGSQRDWRERGDSEGGDSRSRDRDEQNRRRFYEHMNREIESQVAAGKLTREQANRKWGEIKAAEERQRRERR
ncbi:EF hand [Rubripirellula amarantea]|uniref:EF hand n=1 Tax=Rubripirellula amarantea TaxID=2527999 RepID=A0A5C5WIE1_9BACT|nr:proprotein convertase P-domain-containing protein [Rubripirellula amarantea]TWT50584.1 EF hand [Rubripirellula amarantea]